MTSSFSPPSLRSRVEGIALLVVIGLLFAMAVVQHRWLKTIAEGERRKLGEEAADKAVAIAQDVDRELTRAFLELRIDARTLNERNGVLFSERFERWRSESSHAGLVKSVLIAEPPSTGPSRLLRFDPSQSTFIEEPWPESLAAVKAAVEGDAARDLSLMVLGLPTVMADVPALLSPVLDVVVDQQRVRDGIAPGLTQVRELFMRHAGRGSVEILLLDPTYLKESLVGALAESRLGPGSSFTWSVVRGRSGESLAGISAPSKGPADATAPLLRLRFDELDKSLLRGVIPGLPDVVTKSSLRVVVQMGGRAVSRQVNESGLSVAPWTLLLRHREGSIDLAVRSQQRRNTALSASILGVLGLSAGLVFFSARRLRSIASQQVEFVAAMSHELRTPLAVIRSAADNLADGVVQDKDQARRYGTLIRNESVRLADMVEHVLEFAGADAAGRAGRGPIDPVDAARAAVAGMEALIKESGAVVTVEAPTGAPRVNGDMSHLTRAISNLLGNALKYGGSKPQVSVRVLETGTGVEIKVADAGSGLTSSEIPRLFEPFYRGQRATEAQIPGSGLGLALVKRIVEGHGGKVSASNGPGGGALFTIALPSA